MDGYLVQQPWADLIANGTKKWDLRTAKVYLPSRPFYILATARPHDVARSYDPSRLGVAVGIGRSEGVLGPFTVPELEAHFDKHQIPGDVLARYARGKSLYAMVIAGEPMAPRRFRYKPGAVTLMVSVELAPDSTR